MRFRRVILDEAHAIKNRATLSFEALRAIDAKIRWAITATPAMNRPAEFYPYLMFLKVPQVGRFECFKQNFIDPESDIGNKRLHAFLKLIMCRRVHSDRFRGKVLLKLPRFHSYTMDVEFGKTERYLYGLIAKRYIERIYEYRSQGSLERNRRNMLTYLLRLRQMCSHFFLVQKDVEDLLDGEDLDEIWSHDKNNMLLDIVKAFTQKREMSFASEAVQQQEEPLVEQEASEKPFILDFRVILKNLRKKKDWKALNERSVCAKCGHPCTANARITNCMHLFCEECIEFMYIEAYADGAEHPCCVACDTEIKDSGRPCQAIKELGPDLSESAESVNGTERIISSKRKYKNSKSNSDTSWMSIKGVTLTSSKTSAFTFLVRQWIAKENDVKILAFTQFTTMVRLGADEDSIAN